MPDSPGVVERFAQARRNPELVVLEGFHAVKHALRFGAELSVVVGADAAEIDRLAAALAPDVRTAIAADLQIVSPETFSRLAPQPPRTGVLAIAPRPLVKLEAVVGDRSPRPLVLLEEPRDLANMGASIRVAVAADAAGVLTSGTRDPWRPEAVRGSAGLHFALPVARISDQASFGDRGLVAIDPSASRSLPTQIPPRSVLAFGTERHGLSEQLLARADQRVSIPMRTGVSSLNLATAVAVILFAVRLAQPDG